MKLNNIYSLLIFMFIASVGFFSCTDLENEEVDSIVIETTEGGETSADPDALLGSLYNDLSIMTDQANIYALSAHSSDEMIPPTRGVDWGDNGVWRVMHAHTWDATNSWVVGAWNQLNQRVFNATQALAANPSANTRAELQFLRAFYMHQLVDLYGQVPFREANEGVDVDPRVLTRTEALDFVINDLTEALPNLPAIAPTANNTQASVAAANALLSRLYLNRAVYTSATPEGPYNFEGADMTAAIAAADAVEAEGYTLEANYFDNFNPVGQNEIILTSPQGSPQNRVWMTLHYSQNPSGWNGFTTLASFYDLFDADDQRIGNPQGPADGTEFSGIGRGFLIGQQLNDDGSETIDDRTQIPLDFTRDVPLAGAPTANGIRVMKYHPSNFGDTNYRLLRFGEVYLNRAEARFRSGDTSGALNDINALRTARGASSLTSLDEASLLEERGRELYWEGNRRQDQIRFGTFTGTWEEKTNTESFRVLYPIPSIAISSNPNLTQNDGY